MEKLNETIDQMLEIKDLIAQHKFELKRLEQQEELLNVKFIAYLKKAGVNEMQMHNCSFGYKTTSRTAFDQKLFSTENPDLFNRYRVTKEKQSFEFKVGGAK